MSSMPRSTASRATCRMYQHLRRVSTHGFEYQEAIMAKCLASENIAVDGQDRHDAYRAV